MDITLADVLALEPHLTLSRATEMVGCTELDLERVEVSWAVTAKTMAPHLPTLRGREMLLIPPRVVAELGGNVAALVREAIVRHVSAVIVASHELPALTVIERSDDVPTLMWGGDLTIDVETQINRHLTECRGELYRIGSELERQLADLTVSRAGIEAFVHVSSQAAAVPVSVFDARGTMLSSTRLEMGTPSEEKSGEHDIVRQGFGGGVIELGPLQADQRVIARFLAPRLALAAEAALQRDDAARPRGPRRIEATAALLAGRRANASDQRAAALAIGLDPDGVYLVAIGQGSTDSAVVRALAPLGDVYPAGGENGRRTVLIATSGRAASLGLNERVADVKRNWESAHESDGATLAFSAPAIGVASLPAATREAEFVVALQSQSAFQRRAASFASVDDIGALRLLYHLRESSELRSFVSEALGALEVRDRRGTLRATLRTFLESGGSQVDASTRLGIHRNTLAYRLRRIGELVGRDIADPASWLTLHLALRASEMLEAYAHES